MSKDKYAEYVEVRLREWASEYKRGNNIGLGYPSESIEYRLFRGHLIKNKGKNYRSIPSNPRAEEIEKWVMQLYKLREIHAKILREWYFSNKKTPREALASKHNMSVRTFEDYLKLGRWYIFSKLSSEEKWC